MDPGYSSNVREIAPVDVVLANVTTVSATKFGMTRIAVRGNIIRECKAYCIREIKLSLLPCTHMDEYGITVMFKPRMCRLF